MPRGLTMYRSIVNLVFDLLSLLVMLGVISTGLVIKYVLPPGSSGYGRGQGLTLWAWRRHDWGDVHFWLALVLLGLLAVHVALHWRWVCATVGRWTRRDHPAIRPQHVWPRRVAGALIVGACGAAIAAFVWGANVDVRSARDRDDNCLRHNESRACVDRQQQDRPHRGGQGGGQTPGGWRGGRDK